LGIPYGGTEVFGTLGGTQGCVSVKNMCGL